MFLHVYVCMFSWLWLCNTYTVSWQQMLVEAHYCLVYRRKQLCCILCIYICKPQIHRRTICYSGTNDLLISDFGSSTGGERPNSYYANHPQYSAHLVVQSHFLNVMVGPEFLNIMVGTQLQLFLMEADNPTVCLHGPKSTPNWLFFKIFKFSGPSLPSVTLFTIQPYFLSGVYYDNCDCHILSARA